MPKLSAYIYQFPLGVCTNGPSTFQQSVETHFKAERDGAVDAIGFSMDEANTIVNDSRKYPAGDYIIVEDICCGSRRLRAIECESIRAGVWTMCGGNIMANCDSRWFHGCVSIHDRVEGPDQTCRKEDHPYWNVHPLGPVKAFEGTPLYRAASVIRMTPHIHEYLKAKDPKALEQLVNALQLHDIRATPTGV